MTGQTINNEDSITGLDFGQLKVVRMQAATHFQGIHFQNSE